MKKIPEITFMFWVMKICATTLGETAGDLLSMTLNVGYGLSSLILMGFFLATLAIQLAAHRYWPPLYWGVILSTSTAGTTMSDFMDRTLELGYVRGTLLLLAVLGATFAGWRATGKSLAVDQVMSRRTEVFYWSAILISNTLGTALGDFLAHSSGLGFAGGALLVAALLLLVVLASLFTRISRVALFWMAFVLTRPFGATMGDVLTKSPDEGGLGFGTIGSSLILGGLLAGLVAFAMWSGRKRALRG